MTKEKEKSSIDLNYTRTTIYLDNNVKKTLDSKIESRKKSLFINEVLAQALGVKMIESQKNEQKQTINSNKLESKDLKKILDCEPEPIDIDY